MVEKIIQKKAYAADYLRIWFMFLGLNKKDKDRHLVVEVPYKQPPKRLLFLNKVAIPQVPAVC